MAAWEEIERAVRAGDAARVADVCTPLDEDERLQLFDLAWALYGQLFMQTDEGVWKAVRTAVFALGSPTYADYAIPERMEQLVRARPRAWRDEWLRHALTGRGPDKWLTFRSLQRSGDCDPPAPEDVTKLLLRALSDESVDAVALVLADPELLADEIWAPFRGPWWNGYDGWEKTVLALADAGEIPRARVLDEFLAFIARAEHERAYSHLVAVHDHKLAPSTEEISTRRAVYLRLLGDERGRVVGMAAAALTRLDRVQPLDGRELLAHLGLRAETEVERAVALAGRVLEREPALRGWLAEALEHPAPEVQEAARELLEGRESSWEEIERAAEAGEIERVAELCLTLEEPARARLAARSVALKQRLFGGMWTNPVPRGGQTARFGLGPPIPEDEHYLEPPYSHLEALVRSRPRAWRDAWARWVVHGGHRDKVTAWRTLRTLIRDGSCAAPDSTSLLLWALMESHDPADELRAFPEVLDEEIWRPFTHERDTLWDTHWPAWERALIELSAEGAIARERLLDETLTALHQRTDAGTLKALFRFHDKQLKPSPAELATREDGYLRLLESDRDATIGFALAVILRLDRKHPVDGRALLDRLDAAVGLRSKTHAKRAVTLIGRVLDREPALRSDALLDALGHPSADLQAEAVAVLERHPNAELAASAVDVVDPGLRARVAALAGVEPARVTSAPEVSASGPEPLTPVEDIEELLQLASQLLEGLDDPDEFERFVDGLSRLADVPVPKGRRTALVRRAKRGQNEMGGYVEKLCLKWFGVEAFPFFGSTGQPGAVSRRLAVVMRRLEARRPATLLSAPTHRGGFLAIDVLRARIETGEGIEDDDLALALLRVPVGEASTLPLPPTALPASWDSAALLADPPAAVRRVPAGLRNGFPEGPVSEPGAPVSPARLLAGREGQWNYSPLFCRSLALVWPTRREHYYAGVPYDVGATPTALTAALTTMLYPGETLGEHAAYLIALGLHEADENRLLAADVLADAFATRRIEPAVLGAALAEVVPHRKAARLARALEPVAVAPLQPALEAMLAALELRSPQLIGVIDLLRRIAQDTGTRVSDPKARAYLESLTAKSGKLAREALDVG